VLTRVVEPGRARWNVTLMADNSEWRSPGWTNKPSRYVTGPRYTWWVTQAFRGPAEPFPVSQSGQTRGPGRFARYVTGPPARPNETGRMHDRTPIRGREWAQRRSGVRLVLLSAPKCSLINDRRFADTTIASCVRHTDAHNIQHATRPPFGGFVALAGCPRIGEPRAESPRCPTTYPSRGASPCVTCR